MWLLSSSIGRKVVMAVTGMALILFLLFHGCMNLALVFSAEAYNWICSALGANWYAIIGTLGLAALVVIHFCFAIWLTLQNRRARGNDRYAVTASKAGVPWESENMLVLGIIVIGFLVLHLYNFWYNMQYAELTGCHSGPFDPQDGASYVKALFSSPIYCILYLIWLVALWFHLNHGAWSALHTMGWDGKTWEKRTKVIGTIIATLVILPFATVIVYFMVVNIL